MRKYVLVVLMTGPRKVPAGAERDEMFKGHFANINRLSAEGKLVLAGPLDGVDGWRGLLVLAVADIDEARRLVAADPVIREGEMVAEYHTYYGSAALMLVRDAHDRVAKTFRRPSPLLLRLDEDPPGAGGARHGSRLRPANGEAWRPFATGDPARLLATDWSGRGRRSAPVSACCRQRRVPPAVAKSTSSAEAVPFARPG